MKKALFIYLFILIGLFILLSALGSKGDYIIEKKIWRLYQQQLDIAKDPAVVPDKAFENVIDGYKRIIAKYPDSRLTLELQIRLGEMYTLRKDYQKAREVFKEIIERYPGNKEISAEAMFKIGKTYEFEQNWTEASKIYNTILREYSGTDTAMNVPIYIANYYRGQNDFQKTMEAYEVAIRYYKKIASDYEGKKPGLTALRFLSNCYLEQNRWNEAINTLGHVIEKYAASGYLSAQDVDAAVKTINIVSAYQLRNYDVAINVYQGIIDRNPNSPLSRYLKKVIDAFHQLREKGVNPSDLK